MCFCGRVADPTIQVPLTLAGWPKFGRVRMGRALPGKLGRGTRSGTRLRDCGGEAVDCPLAGPPPRSAGEEFAPHGTCAWRGRAPAVSSPKTLREGSGAQPATSE